MFPVWQPLHPNFDGLPSMESIAFSTLGRGDIFNMLGGGEDIGQKLLKTGWKLIKLVTFAQPWLNPPRIYAYDYPTLIFGGTPKFVIKMVAKDELIAAKMGWFLLHFMQPNKIHRRNAPRPTFGRRGLCLLSNVFIYFIWLIWDLMQKKS